MNEYYNNFMKYYELSEETKRREMSFQELIAEVRKRMVKNDQKDKHAVIVLGYSGNGKTTYIRHFLEKHPEYSVVSMDIVANQVLAKNSENPGEEIVTKFGESLEKVGKSNLPVLIDGNFLNLLTRASLIDTLTSYGYQIDIADLTGHIEETIERRMRDVAKQRYGISEEQFKVERNQPRIKAIEKEILDFLEDEKARSLIEEQKTYDAVALGIHEVFDRDDEIKFQKGAQK